MAYTDFCKHWFHAGLPDKKNGLLPKLFTDIDFRELKVFLAREEVMSEAIYKNVIVKNLDAKGMWKLDIEKTLDGKEIKTIKFKDALPYIILGFFCFITLEVENKLARIADPEQIATEQDTNSAIVKKV